MLENVRGILDKVFEDYRATIVSNLKQLGYVADWRLLNVSDYGVPQLRPRVVLVALRENRAQHFSWPMPRSVAPQTVGKSLFDLMAPNLWRGAKAGVSEPQPLPPPWWAAAKSTAAPISAPPAPRRPGPRLVWTAWVSPMKCQAKIL